MRLKSLVRTCLTLCCSLTFRLPRAHYLPHSLFLLPRHQNTHYNRDNTIYSKNTQYIMNLSSPVDKQRHQESLWRENLQSGGNPRTTPSTGYEPKELPSVSRIWRITDSYQLYDAQEEFGEEDHRVPITEEVKQFGGFGTHGLRDLYTLTCRTHIFLRTADSVRTSRIFIRVTYTHGSSSCQQGVCCTCVILLHLAFSCLMIHPSLLFLRGHFETNPGYDSTDNPIHMILPYFPVLKAQDTRNSAPASRSLATWPSQMQTQAMSPTSSTRSLLWTMTRCSLTIQTSMKSLTSRKTHTRTLDSSVFSQCLNPLFRTFLMMILLFK